MGGGGGVAGPGVGIVELDAAVAPRLETYAFCLEHAPDAVFWVAEDGRLTYVNARACEMLGYAREELLELKLFDFNESYPRQQFEADWRRYAQLPLGGMTTLRIDTELRRKDGSRFPADVAVRHIRTADGHFNVAFARDASERIATEHRLRLIQTAIDRAATSTFWARPDGRLFYVNEEACRRLGYTREELMQLHVYDVDAESSAQTWPKVWEAVRAGKVLTFESTHVRKDGALLPVEVIANYARFGDEELVFGFARDLSEEHKVEAERSRLEMELQQAQKMESIGRLAGGVAHDFNNMLGVILGYVDILKEDLHGNEEAIDALEQIGRAAERSRDITRQLLAFSRRQAIVPRVVDVNAQIEQTSKTLKRLVREDVTVDLDLAAELWPVRIDPAQLDQILVNLVVNARDAMADGGVIGIRTRNVAVPEEEGRLPQPGDYVLLEVLDEGVGMEETVKALAFEPFFTTKKPGEGTGLGLSTVFGIVEQNGGDIHMHSEVGKGTRIEVLFPRATSTATRPVADEAGEADAAVGRRVMVVEDEPMLRELVVKMLRDLGYEVSVPSGATEALYALQDSRREVDLVVTDVVMPTMSGPALRTAAHEVRPELPFLFISGYASGFADEHGFLPADAHLLSKPFTKQDLATEVFRALGKPT